MNDASKHEQKMPWSRRLKRQRKTRLPHKPTLADVAAHAQVSTATVSRFLSAPEVVRPKLKQRVELAIQELNYVPDGAARALVTRRSSTVGVIVPTLDVAIFAVVVQALQEAFFAANHTPLLAVSNFDPAVEFKQAQSLLRHGIDGLVLVGIDHDPALHVLFERYQVPYVNTWTTQTDGWAPSIGFDNRTAMKTITAHVLDQGHRNLAMIVGGAGEDNDRSRERRLGFHEALKERDIEFRSDWMLNVPYNMESGRQAFRNVWSKTERPTAIVCGSDLFALGTLIECQRLGIRVPDELSVTGFDDLEIAGHFSPPITTMRVPAVEMSNAAARHLLKLLKGQTVQASLEFPCDLVVRGTVGPIAPGLTRAKRKPQARSTSRTINS